MPLIVIAAEGLRSERSPMSAPTTQEDLTVHLDQVAVGYQSLSGIARRTTVPNLTDPGYLVIEV